MAPMVQMNLTDCAGRPFRQSGYVAKPGKPAPRLGEGDYGIRVFGNNLQRSIALHTDISTPLSRRAFDEIEGFSMPKIALASLQAIVKALAGERYYAFCGSGEAGAALGLRGLTDGFPIVYKPSLWERPQETRPQRLHVQYMISDEGRGILGGGQVWVARLQVVLPATGVTPAHRKSAFEDYSALRGGLESALARDPFWYRLPVRE